MEPVLFAALVFLGILLVFMSMLMGQQLDPVQARLQQIAVRPRTLEELELQRPIGERTIKPVIQGISRLIGRFWLSVSNSNFPLRHMIVPGTWIA